MPLMPGRQQRQQQHGFSLVEMMVGITIGMIVVAGASVMMVNQLDDHRRLVLETQVQQDLRAAADLVLRDLRRAGYHGASANGVWARGAAAATPNLYARQTSVNEGATELLYSYSRDDVEDGIPNPNEHFGYQVQGGVLKFLYGGNNNWQPVTDPNTLKITAFQVILNTQTVTLAEFCQRPCPPGSDCPPRQLVRDVNLTLTGEAVQPGSLGKVERSVHVGTRLRNDAVEGGC
jgi:prepilin peptidase dependent protein B